MRFIAAIGLLLGDIWHDFSRQMATKLRWMLVGLGVAGAILAVPRVIMPLVAEMSFTPSTATVIRAGWACSDSEARMHWCAKSEVDARRAAKSKQRSAYFVHFIYPAPDGKILNEHWPITATGLRESEAVRGHRFGILVDPADPRRVSTRFGADMRNTLLMGASLLSLFLGVTWWVAAYRRRRREAAQAFVPPPGPVFTTDGRRIRPLAPAPAFGKRAASR